MLLSKKNNLFLFLLFFLTLGTVYSSEIWVPADNTVFNNWYQECHTNFKFSVPSDFVSLEQVDFVFVAKRSVRPDFDFSVGYAVNGSPLQTVKAEYDLTVEQEGSNYVHEVNITDFFPEDLMAGKDYVVVELEIFRDRNRPWLTWYNRRITLLGIKVTYESTERSVSTPPEIALDGTSLTLTKNEVTETIDLGSLVNDADSDPTNELNQSLELDENNMLKLEDAGGTLTADLGGLLSGGTVGTVNAGTVEAGNVVVDTLEADKITFSETTEVELKDTINIKTDDLTEVTVGDTTYSASDPVDIDANGDLSIANLGTLSMDTLEAGHVIVEDISLSGDIMPTTPGLNIGGPDPNQRFGTAYFGSEIDHATNMIFRSSTIMPMKTTAVVGVDGNVVAGEAFLVNPSGNISMGSYTNGPTPDSYLNPTP